MTGLRLEVYDFADLTRWRWVLTNAGRYLADHAVQLDDSSWQYEAFTDLAGYLSWQVAPDRRRADEERIVSDLGRWITARVLGPSIVTALVENGPAAVRVVVPEDAKALLARPLELAYLNDKPVATQNVTLIMQPSEARRPASRPVGDRLRVLGLFSLPGGSKSLNLRRERHSLTRLVAGVRAQGRAVDLRVLQYGVTRDHLREILADAGGWDIIHVSGHGRPGELVLETAAGNPDPVSATDLADLLDLTRERVRLITLAACWSAAVAVTEQRRLLGLPVADQAERFVGSHPPHAASDMLAAELSARLGCAVLAMRYQVDDEFAIELAKRFYALLVDEGEPLPRAVATTLRELSGAGASELSVATPALFGPSAIDLTLAAPRRPGPDDDDDDDDDDPGHPKMVGFPPQLDRFVGRTALMAKASAALAERSGIPGVLLHGMPGGGKSACALELAYGHEHAFDRLIWYKAPDEGSVVTGTSLTGFTLVLEDAVPGLQLAHVLASAETLLPFLPVLTDLMERKRLLLVIDNAESLCTEVGHWHDDRWALVIGALTGHTGRSRLIMTSRRVPARLTGLHVEPVDALTPDEALLLARELPNLSALTLGRVPELGQSASRLLARNVLEVAQGHPKLLELAEGQAANPGHLLELVRTGDQTWRTLGGLPAGFFATGAAALSAVDYLEVIAAWTRAVTDTLAPGEQDLFWLLCCLEELERIRPIVSPIWTPLWRDLGRNTPQPALDEALATVTARGLVSYRWVPVGVTDWYGIHPGVAAAGREQAGQAFQTAAATVAASYLIGLNRRASWDSEDGQADTQLLVHTGMAVIPYLIRLQRWQNAAWFLTQAFLADPSRANAARALPVMRQIAAHVSGMAGALAAAQRVLDPATEEWHGTDLAAAVMQGDHKVAAFAAGRLADQCRDSGQLAQALSYTDQAIEHARQAEWHPWGLLDIESRRPRVLYLMGQNNEALEEARRLLHRSRELFVTNPGGHRAVNPATVREGLLDTARNAATRLHRWDEALSLSAEITASMRDRSAPAAQIARSAFNDAAPLINLGRIQEAFDLLVECRKEFQEAGNIAGLSKVSGALAHIEHVRGHGENALRFSMEDLRYGYLAGEDATSIASSYHNLGAFLHLDARQVNAALACHLAAALLAALAGVGGTEEGSTLIAANSAAIDLRALGDAAVLPTSVADLSRQIGNLPGTDFPGLVARLSATPATAEEFLRELITLTRYLADRRLMQ
jgi:tetratricopeptide (TPR) repeat protein